MERLEQLIGKLKEQFEKNVPASQLLVITKQIEAELSRAGSKRASTIGTAKVAVVMPSAGNFNYHEEEEIADFAPQEIKQPEQKNKVAAPPKIEQNTWIFDPISEIPTLAHQSNGKELNDTIGNTESLNDKLKKEDVKDFASALKESPLRDLKKAIGINDRFVFINELFRGDEAMYERSIKTINNFRILQEAEYWMIRELKVKLAWDDDKETTKHFYQLVKRRFS
jgi:hypothetical protein